MKVKLSISYTIKTYHKEYATVYVNKRVKKLRKKAKKTLLKVRKIHRTK